MNISIIEDDPDCSENYVEFLEARGHKLTVYNNADSVIDNIDKICRSEVIILDLMMQLGTKIRPSEADETGTAIYKRIRLINKDIPIVIITAKSYADIRSDFSSDKKSCYLGKPIRDLEMLYEAVEKWS